ncbi:hypothetical protein BDP27DRAFT_1546848, partial [Rhodocollybia butyracea]
SKILQSSSCHYCHVWLEAFDPRADCHWTHLLHLAIYHLYALGLASRRKERKPNWKIKSEDIEALWTKIKDEKVILLWERSWAKMALGRKSLFSNPANDRGRSRRKQAETLEEVRAVQFSELGGVFGRDFVVAEDVGLNGASKPTWNFSTVVGSGGKKRVPKSPAVVSIRNNAAKGEMSATAEDDCDDAGDSSAIRNQTYVQRKRERATSLVSENIQRTRALMQIRSTVNQVPKESRNKRAEKKVLSSWSRSQLDQANRTNEDDDVFIRGKGTPSPRKPTHPTVLHASFGPSRHTTIVSHASGSGSGSGLSSAETDIPLLGASHNISGKDIKQNDIVHSVPDALKPESILSSKVTALNKHMRGASLDSTVRRDTISTTPTFRQTSVLSPAVEAAVETATRYSVHAQARSMSPATMIDMRRRQRFAMEVASAAAMAAMEVHLAKANEAKGTLEPSKIPDSGQALEERGKRKQLADQLSLDSRRLTEISQLY